MSGFSQGRERLLARCEEGWIRSESALRRLLASWATDLSRSTRKFSAQEAGSSGEGSSSWIRSNVSIPSEVEVEAWEEQCERRGTRISPRKMTASWGPFPPLLAEPLRCAISESFEDDLKFFLLFFCTLPPPAYCLDSLLCYKLPGKCLLPYWGLLNITWDGPRFTVRYTDRRYPCSLGHTP